MTTMTSTGNGRSHGQSRDCTDEAGQALHSARRPDQGNFAAVTGRRQSLRAADRVGERADGQRSAGLSFVLQVRRREISPRPRPAALPARDYRRRGRALRSGCQQPRPSGLPQRRRAPAEDICARRRRTALGCRQAQEEAEGRKTESAKPLAAEGKQTIAVVEDEMTGTVLKGKS